MDGNTCPVALLLLVGLIVFVVWALSRARGDAPATPVELDWVFCPDPDSAHSARRIPIALGRPATGAGRACNFHHIPPPPPPDGFGACCSPRRHEGHEGHEATPHTPQQLLWVRSGAFVPFVCFVPSW